ncbi:hypothetical protein VTL71DRAFT_11903 [Oculimacula yallundae]|uniref:Uncharacterized protein n=1 Tax=Oculimacula yallundae TaxID=86028 RepID=A0ABR4CRI5_9HELO
MDVHFIQFISVPPSSPSLTQHSLQLEFFVFSELSTTFLWKQRINRIPLRKIKSQSNKSLFTTSRNRNLRSLPFLLSEVSLCR